MIPSLSSSSDVDVGPPPPPPSQEEEDDGVIMGPTGSVNSNDSDDDDKMIGPPPPPATRDSDDDDVDDNEENRYKIPLSNEIQLKGHTKIVSSLAVDSAGARVLSGSYDYTVRMYDFQGMNSRLQSFRQIEPSEGHQVRSVSWSPTSSQFLCVTGSAQAKVIKPKLSRPGRVPVTTCAWDRDGKRIAGGIGDGSIQIWSIKPGWGSRPDIYVGKAHTDDITSVKFSSDRRILLSGSFDGSLKLAKRTSDDVYQFSNDYLWL